MWIFPDVQYMEFMKWAELNYYVQTCLVVHYVLTGHSPMTAYAVLLSVSAAPPNLLSPCGTVCVFLPGHASAVLMTSSFAQLVSQAEIIPII